MRQMNGGWQDDDRGRLKESCQFNKWGCTEWQPTELSWDQISNCFGSDQNVSQVAQADSECLLRFKILFKNILLSDIFWFKS